MYQSGGQRFAARRLAGLADAPRSGKPARYDAATEKRVLNLLDESPPKGYSQWNGRLLWEVLPDISKDQIWRILRRHDICLERRRSWCISTDPEFGPKAADVVGLYLNPAGERARAGRGRETVESGSGAGPGVFEIAGWEGSERVQSLL